mgnify:CR=1 FL=1
MVYDLFSIFQTIFQSRRQGKTITSLPDLPNTKEFRLEYNFKTKVARYLLCYKNNVWANVYTDSRTVIPSYENANGEIIERRNESNIYKYSSVQELEMQLNKLLKQ